MTVVVVESRSDVAIDRLEDELTGAFERMREAVERGDAVVVSLDERDVQGAGDPAQAAYAHGLIGLVRALATEGLKPGWRVAALSAPHGLHDDERRRWIEQLAASDASSGTLVRLGGEHLGRAPV